MSEKRFSPSCENNRLPILEQLKRFLPGKASLLEIGSGTGQHAAYFGPEFPYIHWQTSDVLENHPSIKAWLADTGGTNLIMPLAFRIGEDKWPDGVYDAVYTANTAHIMQKREVQIMMQLVNDNLTTGGFFLQYGPFRRDGEFSGASNQAFHQRLLAEGLGGYRDITELQTWATGMTLIHQIAMPANNVMLVWKKDD